MANNSLPIQRYIRDFAKDDIMFESLNAIINSSNTNRRITAMDFSKEPGKKRKFMIKYVAPNCDDTGDCGADLCAPGIRQSTKDEVFELKKCTASPVYEFAVDDPRDIDGINGNEWAMQQISANLSTVRKKLAVQVLAELIAHIGLFEDGSATKKLQITSPIDGSIRPYGINELKRTYSDLNMNQPFVLGGRSVSDLKFALGIAATNFAGQNLSRIDLANSYYDSLVNQAFGGGEHIISWDASYFKFLSFNRNAGRFATDFKNFNLQDAYQSGDEYMHSTILDPVTGLLWDLNAIYDKCTRVWRFQFQIEWDMFFMPQSMCLPNDVNGILHWTGCEPVEFDCPVGTVTPPPTPVVFTWTPAAACYPSFIDTLSIAGRTFAPEVNIANINELVAVLNGTGVGVFTTNGTDITYTGFSAYSGMINGITPITFA